MLRNDYAVSIGFDVWSPNILVGIESVRAYFHLIFRFESSFVVVVAVFCVCSFLNSFILPAIYRTNWNSQYTIQPAIINRIERVIFANAIRRTKLVA